MNKRIFPLVHLSAVCAVLLFVPVAGYATLYAAVPTQTTADDTALVVTEDSSQPQLVSAIALAQSPYTGFEAGKFSTFFFYLLLVLWALYITHLVVIRTNQPVVSKPSASVLRMRQAEALRPDAFPAQPAVTPPNLPIGEAQDAVASAGSNQSTEQLVTKIENFAHAQKTLLSSDAVRYLMGVLKDENEYEEKLQTVIDEGMEVYPLEDGWLVLNEARMEHICDAANLTHEEKPASKPTFTPKIVPEGAGSLAEAIMEGNVTAAYTLIGKRPMFSLADAAADFDAVYRQRQGKQVRVSALLKEKSARLSDQQLKTIITALSSALDGSYDTEEEAVKMSILRAIAVVTK